MTSGSCERNGTRFEYQVIPSITEGICENRTGSKIMMYEKPDMKPLPKTVDEVADLLISDLPPQEMETLSHMGEDEFLQLYDSVANYLLEEFRVWTGNDALLASCMQRVTPTHQVTDPAMIILRRVWQKLAEFPEIVIIT